MALFTSYILIPKGLGGPRYLRRYARDYNVKKETVFLLILSCKTCVQKLSPIPKKNHHIYPILKFLQSQYLTFLGNGNFLARSNLKWPN